MCDDSSVFEKGIKCSKFYLHFYVFHIRALRDVYNYVVNQQCTLIKYALSYIYIYLQVLVAFATVIRVLYKNTDNVQQCPKLYKYNHLLLQRMSQVLRLVIKC